MHRRRMLQTSTLGLSSIFAANIFASTKKTVGKKPLVISTWAEGINANKAAWQVLKNGGKAIDAVEKGVMVTENETDNCCVGLNAYPDRDGFVTLDASIMNEHGDAGCVAFLERIKHPISVARAVMEKTPHVMLVGSGAQQFAVEEGFKLEPEVLSDAAKKVYDEWLKKHDYKPIINIENSKGQNKFNTKTYLNDTLNHDTIGMLAIDAQGNLSGSCTTSGLAFKMRGRVGDSPIIGSGLYVDNEVGAATSSGVGEEVMKICGSHTIIELMRNGKTPTEACKIAVERIVKRNTTQAIKDIQVAFIALDKQGNYGAYSIQKGFNFSVCYADDQNNLIDAQHIF